MGSCRVSIRKNAAAKISALAGCYLKIGGNTIRPYLFPLGGRSGKKHVSRDGHGGLRAEGSNLSENDVLSMVVMG